jgi:hypothetical protein
MEQGSGATKIALIGALSRIGGEKALAAVRVAMKDADAAVQDAAIRATTDWPDAAATDDMLAIAKSENQKNKVLALRGLLRVTAAANRPAGDTLKLYKQMMDACTRPEDRKIVLAGLGDVKDAAALNMAMSYVADDALRSEAAAAAIKIARNINPRRDPARSALQKIMADNAVSESLRKQAQDALK